MILVKVIFNKIFTAEILKKTLKTNSKVVTFNIRQFNDERNEK